jgi:uncharacterized protein YcbK (DUF882 family)
MTGSGTKGATLSRRQLLISGGALAAGMAPLSSALAGQPRRSVITHTKTGARGLAFKNLHNGEAIKLDYFANGEYMPEALRELDRFMRDVRDNTRHHMDPHLYDLLFDLHALMDTPEPFMLISGYRSPRTNAWLRRRSHGVAKHSLHMKGLASDVRLHSRDPRHLYRAARALKRGGVGLYTRSNFVHVDTGRVRHWGA